MQKCMEHFHVKKILKPQSIRISLTQRPKERNVRFYKICLEDNYSKTLKNFITILYIRETASLQHTEKVGECMPGGQRSPSLFCI